MTTTRILQFGQTGQVAREMIARAGAAGASVRALSRADADLTDAEAVRRAVAEAAGETDLVVNAAAYTAVDAAESDEATAHSVNAKAPRAMAQACREHGLGLIHLSTDYVFDGSKSGAYREDDPVAPLGAYGRSKQAGEAAVLDAHGDAVVMRTAWVFSPWGKNFLTTMVRLAERDTLSIVADQTGCPTPAGEIAEAVLAVAGDLRANSNGRGGVYHFTGGAATTWHGFAEAIFQAMSACGEATPTLTAISTADYPTPAARPANSVLDCSKIERVFGVAPADWKRALDRDLSIILSERGRS